MKTSLHYPFWQRLGKANHDYQLIQNGDKIAVGLSGGKDSMVLLYALAKLQRRSPIKFDLMAITLELGWNTDLQPAVDFCKDLNIPYHIEYTDIGNIVFEHRNEKNPCSLCAKMKRGALHNTAKRYGYNKIALAHHLDDAIETLLLNMFYAGRIKSFLPKTYLNRKDVTLIRPLIYIEEDVIRQFTIENNIPIIPSGCPANGLTKRQELKELIISLEKNIPDIRSRLGSALKNVEIGDFWTIEAQK